MGSTVAPGGVSYPQGVPYTAFDRNDMGPFATALTGFYTGGPLGAIAGGIFGSEFQEQLAGLPVIGGLFGEEEDRIQPPFAPGVGRFAGYPTAVQAYQFGQYDPITPLVGAEAGHWLFANPFQRATFQEIERRSPLRTASWAEPLRGQLAPEVQQAISAMIGLTPTKLGVTAYYGDLARRVQELVGAPELGAARQFIGSRLQEGLPQDMENALRQDIRTAQAARGLSYGEAAVSDEARKLTMFREQQRQNLLGPAMTLGFQTLGMTGFPEMAQIGPVNFAPVGTDYWQRQEQEWAELGTYLNLAGSIAGAVGTGLGLGLG